MSLKSFLKQNLNYSDDRVTLIELSVKQPNELLESLDELNENSDLLRKAQLTENELRSFRVETIKLKKLLLDFELVLVENEDSLNDKQTEDQDFEKIFQDFKRKNQNSYEQCEIKLMKEAFKKRIEQLKSGKTESGVVSLMSIVKSGPLSLIFKNLSFPKEPVFKSIISSSDEIVGYLKSFDNVYISNAAGGALMFGVLMCYSVGKNFYSYYKGEIDKKQILKFLTIDAVCYGVTTSVSTATAIIGALLGGICLGAIGPFTGTLIGSCIGICVTR